MDKTDDKLTDCTHAYIQSEFGSCPECWPDKPTGRCPDCESDDRNHRNVAPGLAGMQCQDWSGWHSGREPWGHRRKENKPTVSEKAEWENVHAMNCMCWKDRPAADPGTGPDTRCLSVRAAVQRALDEREAAAYRLVRTMCLARKEIGVNFPIGLDDELLLWIAAAEKRAKGKT